jgi:predicted AAA+ superfamily ATPase
LAAIPDAVNLDFFTLQYKSIYLILLDMKRLYEDLLHEYLEMFPCVAVLGARQCGKTTLVRGLGHGWKYYDLERGADYDVIGHDPDLFLRLNSGQVIIDEAQLMPKLFPALRVAIDDNRRNPGRFVVTGSSSPDLVRALSESLAGRIGIIEMSPLLWSEVSGVSSSSLLSRLSAGILDPASLLDGLSSAGSTAQAFEYWFRGGYPEPWLRNDERFSERWSEHYIQTYLQRDIASLFPGLDRTRFRLFLQMLGGLSGQVINTAQVARALGVSQPTARDYFEIAHGTFVWRKLPAFQRATAKRVVKHSKGYLRDSGLLHHLLHIPTLDALLRHPQVGLSWEGMVIEEIIRRFNSRGVAIDTTFYRTGAGAEVDLVCEGRFGIVPFEIKRGQRVDLRDLRGLRGFVSEMGCPVGIVVNNDIEPRFYNDSIIGVPFTCL